MVIVGAGPAGLASACRLKQIDSELNVCVLEKGSAVGAHILSGAILDSRALDELFPDWKNMGAPVTSQVSCDEIYYFSGPESSVKIPGFLAPKTMNNHGNHIISLGNLCRWLAEQAENMGVDIFPGFAASEILYTKSGAVRGVATGDMGIGKDGEHKSSYQPGMELHAPYTIFAEGCRGSLGKQLIEKFQLAEKKDPQHYALGFKELWRIPKNLHRPGFVQHCAGWPLSESGSHGGSFLYHFDDDLVALGLVVDLSYSNCHLSPFDEFQRHKHHPKVAQYLLGAERLSYGARTISKGGLQSQPQLHCPGALLVGDDAGTLNFARIKGTHTAMKSGMLAAESVAAEILERRSESQAENDAGRLTKSLASYQSAYEGSWAYQELHMQRNFGPAQQRWGNFFGSAYSFIDINLFSGALPWTLRNTVADHKQLNSLSDCQPINYPKADGVLSFDKLSSVFLSNTNHEEDQPCHLQLTSESLPVTQHLIDFDEPAQRYCPAGVYEIITTDSETKLQINAQNCIHCKACDIKDPSQNITWRCPEGGGGPNYPNM